MNAIRLNLNSLILFLGILFVCPLLGYSQNAESADTKAKDKRAIDPPFDSGILIDNQTVVVPGAKSLEFMIQHRFGTLNSTTFDLAGLYAPSNIRLGLRYSITDNLQFGIGTTKINMLQDVNWKWSILKQTRSGNIPISLTYYGNIAFNVRENVNFGQDYEFSHRLSYFHQIIISRKLTRRLSVQVSGQFAHFNQVDSIAFPDLKHNNFAITVNGRYKVTPQLGVIFSYDMPLTTPEMIKPSAGLGFEIATLSHSFQIFMGSYNRISPQDNMSFNTNDFLNGDILIGFNISRRWRF